MSRFLTEKFKGLSPYVPGEQPQDMQYVKLNTNECPYPLPPEAFEYARDHLRALQLYSDPDAKRLRSRLAEVYGLDADEIMTGNGSDELLYYAVMAFCDDTCPLVYPQITYGFYPVIADLTHVPVCEIPLKEDFTIDPEDYRKADGTVFIANPNAPTGIALSRSVIEEIVQAHPDRVVLVDEAYVDFGGESCMPLICRYDNLLVCRTFSKSRSFAGGRLGFIAGNRQLIADLNRIRNSCNPYNMNNLTEAVALGILNCQETVEKNISRIMEDRQYLTDELRVRGFEVLDSKANFVFARHPETSGAVLYEKLKEQGVLVRHFNKDRIRDFNRITVGNRQELNVLLDRIDRIIGKRGADL